MPIPHEESNKSKIMFDNGVNGFIIFYLTKIPQQPRHLPTFGIVASGDASITAAMKNGGITKIHHVDYHSMQVLGLYAEMTTTVYGD